MKILYVFPHPDDESFGPAPSMSKQRREGHEVHLLTLTRGGATKQRHKFGYSIEEMGRVRCGEMLAVDKVLDLSSHTVLDLPDSGLKDMDPREIERVIADSIQELQPHVVVTYAVHGISGFHDHLISHAVLKRVYVELKDIIPPLQRLAFFSMTEEQTRHAPQNRLNTSPLEDIDCIIETSDEDIWKACAALDCYKSYEEVIKNTGIKDVLRGKVYFELFQEHYDPPLSDLFEGLAPDSD
jgi:LmbE family N-acetylglucosaminyl deacetylase